MRLIVTEKNNSAKKIADILSGGEAKADAVYKVPFYTWSDADGEQMTIGLKGHVMSPSFPEGLLELAADRSARSDRRRAHQGADRQERRQGDAQGRKGSDAIVIATDYDREGELIGLEALEQILDANPAAVDGSKSAPARTLLASRPPIKRARYSALTKEEIERAFAELDDLSYELAYAGATRQDIDLIWGATLTRAVSLATRRFGSNFLSVGRVQSPTLALIVERELERRAHVPKPYWEVFARFKHPDGAFEAHHATDKFWEKAEAEAALAGHQEPRGRQGGDLPALQRKPPTPFNTTAFTTEASNRLGITPKRAMQLAEDLYMDGFISYPRTDNTVYPALARHPRAGLIAGAGAGVRDRGLPARRRPHSHPGKKETTDHPPIYPTQAVHPGALEGPKQRVYELIVAPVPGHLRAADGDRVDARRHRGRIRGLLRAGLGGRRPRLRRHLHLCPLPRRGDPEA